MTEGAEVVMTRGAEEAGAEPGTAGTGLNPEGIRRLLTELSAWLQMRLIDDGVKNICLIPFCHRDAR